MDYETFVNSAFLRQGHADEFTNQPPAKRKDVLASILGLSRYDDLEAKSKESMKIWEDLTGNLQVAIQEIDNELAQRPAIEEELRRTQNEFAGIEKTVKQHETRVNELKQQYETLEAKKNQLSQMEHYITSTQQSIDEWSAQLGRHQKQKYAYEELIAKKNTIEEGFDRFITVKKSYDDMSQKLSLLVRLNERKNKLAMYVEKARSNLLTEHAVIERSISELNTKVSALAQIKNEIQQLESQQTGLSGAETQVEENAWLTRNCVQVSGRWKRDSWNSRARYKNWRASSLS